MFKSAKNCDSLRRKIRGEEEFPSSLNLRMPYFFLRCATKIFSHLPFQRAPGDCCVLDHFVDAKPAAGVFADIVQRGCDTSIFNGHHVSRLAGCNAKRWNALSRFVKAIPVHQSGQQLGGPESDFFGIRYDTGEGGEQTRQRSSSLSTPRTATRSGTARFRAEHASITCCPRKSLQAMTANGVQNALARRQSIVVLPPSHEPRDHATMN